MELNKIPDFPEEYAKILQKTYADAIEVAEAVKAAALADRVAAADERVAATDARNAIEAGAKQFVADYMEQHRTKLIEETRMELLTNLIIKHLKAGRSPAEIEEWLAVSDELIEQQRVKIMLQKSRLKGAHLEYGQQGRGGKIIYRKGETRIDFDWEFGGTGCVALIVVPSEAYWAQRTGLPVSERLAVLDFVAQQVILDQAPNCRYEISMDCISILY